MNYEKYFITKDNSQISPCYVYMLYYTTLFFSLRQIVSTHTRTHYNNNKQIIATYYYTWNNTKYVWCISHFYDRSKYLCSFLWQIKNKIKQHYFYYSLQSYTANTWLTLLGSLICNIYRLNQQLLNYNCFQKTWTISILSNRECTSKINI